MTSRRGGTERVLSKLKTSIENQNYYEAHQMYRTLYFRYLGQKKYVELQGMLYDGAVLLFSHDETASGTDLAKLYVDTLNQAEQAPEELHFVRISKLYQLIPGDNVDKPLYLSTCLKWSGGGPGPGHPRLHQHIAYTLWRAKQYTESRQHFLQSGDGSGCGEMLAEFQQQRGFPTEIDLFIGQTVLQLLCLKKTLEAAAALDAYTRQHPGIRSGPPYPQPLLNFLWFLLLSIRSSQNLTAFTVLCEKYKPALERDPQYLEYLDKIGQHFFGVPAPARPPRPGGMFSGLFDQLLNAMNEDSSEDETAPARPGPSGRQSVPPAPADPQKFEAADLD